MKKVIGGKNPRLHRPGFVIPICFRCMLKALPSNGQVMVWAGKVHRRFAVFVPLPVFQGNGHFRLLALFPKVDCEWT